MNMDHVTDDGDDYICPFDEETLRKAKEKVNEDPEHRLQAVHMLREWVKQQQHLKCQTDTRSMLKFLRAAKFKQGKARSMIDNMIKMSTSRPDWFIHIDTHDPRILAVLDSLYVITLPGRTKDGQQVVLYRMGSFDPSSKTYDKAAILRTFGALFLKMMEEESSQIHGFIYIIDAEDFGLKQQLFWGAKDLSMIANMWKSALPAHFKAFHMCNMGYMFDILLNILKRFLSQKLRDRIIIHKNDGKRLHEWLPVEMLPDEYLPEDLQGRGAGSLKSIVENLKSQLTQQDVRDRILHLTTVGLGVTVSDNA